MSPRLLCVALMIMAAALSRPLESSYDKWLNERVVYIIEGAEREAFLRLMTDAERDRFIEQFWLRRDPTPDTAENEFREEYERRIEYSYRFATKKTPGWKTDRGRIYITWGPPDEVESHPGESYARPAEQGGGTTSTYPFESWRYRYAQGSGIGVTVEFVDQAGNGEFRMIMNPRTREMTPRATGQRSAQATIEITPDRHLLASLPLDFESREYRVSGTISRASQPWASFSAVVSVCKTAPGALNCLAQPVLVIDEPAVADRALEPGPYKLHALITGDNGSVERTYTAMFFVR